MTDLDPECGSGARSHLLRTTWKRQKNKGRVFKLNTVSVLSSQSVKNKPTCVCSDPGPITMLNVCLRLLVLLPLVFCVPSPSRPPSRICRRCCDFQESPASTAQYQIPEVRTVINMTILKGKQPEPRLILYSLYLSWKTDLGWVFHWAMFRLSVTLFVDLVCLDSANQNRKTTDENLLFASAKGPSRTSVTNMSALLAEWVAQSRRCVTAVRSTLVSSDTWTSQICCEPHENPQLLRHETAQEVNPPPLRPQSPSVPQNIHVLYI